MVSSIALSYSVAFVERRRRLVPFAGSESASVDFEKLLRRSPSLGHPIDAVQPRMPHALVILGEAAICIVEVQSPLEDALSQIVHCNGY